MKAHVFGVIVTAVLGTMEAYAHSVPTHHNITRVAVEYLREQAEEFSCFNDSQVQIGTGEEDRLPRPMFHFFPALNSSYASNPVVSSCNSPTWGLTRAPTCTMGEIPIIGNITLTNTFTWPVALDHAKDSTGAPSDLGWSDLGYVVHLLEDLTSPAHVRNDPHFPLIGDGDPVEARTRVPTKPTGGLVTFSSPREFFNSLQGWTQRNFFSKDTCFESGRPGPTATREDDNYFYDANSHRIAYKSARYRWTVRFGRPDRTKTTIDDVIATEQFERLGKQAVLYVASFMRFYYQKTSPAINAVKNGNFESGDLTGWNADTEFGYVAAVRDATTDGRYSVRVGRWDQPYQQGGCFRCGPVPDAEPSGTDFVYQDVALPTGATSLKMNFNYRVDTYDGANYDWFDARIFDAQNNQLIAIPVDHVGGIIEGSPANWGLFYTTDWKNASIDLTPFAGKTVRIMYSVTQDGFGDQIATYIDGVSLECKFSSP